MWYLYTTTKISVSVASLSLIKSLSSLQNKQHLLNDTSILFFCILFLQDEQEMAEVLKKSGLEPDYWVDHFKNIKVAVPKALDHCGQEEFDELSKFVRKQFEEKSSQNIIWINEREDQCMY